MQKQTETNIPAHTKTNNNKHSQNKKTKENTHAIDT